MEKEYKIGDTVELEVFGEICCEVCNEIVHNHIDCPVCKDDYAETDRYGYIEDNNKVECQCGTIYEIASGSWYHKCVAKIVFLKNSQMAELVRRR